jgi:hypothetical protein
MAVMLYTTYIRGQQAIAPRVPLGVIVSARDVSSS